MKRLIILLLCLLLLSGCAAETEYLLSESIWDDGDGTPQRTGYEYDEAGRLIAQTTGDDDFCGMGSLYERIEFEYDDHGQLLREQIYDETGCIRVREYVNAYDGSGQLVHFDSYTDGELFESRTNSYDEQGNLTRTEFIHRSPYSTDTIVENFDQAGNVYRSVTTSELSGTVSSAFTEYFYEDGRLHQTQSDEGGRMVYSYDRRGRLKRVERYLDEALDFYREFTYTADTETEIQYEADGTIITKQVRTYDRSGNLIKEEFFNSEGKCSGTGIYTYIIQ